jgi:transposase InsO family protein
MKSSDVWLNQSAAAKLEGISKQAICKRVKSGCYTRVCQVKGSKGGGTSGKEWQIHLSCLSARAQVAYLREAMEAAKAGGCNGMDTAPDSPVPVEIAQAPATVSIEQRALGLLDYYQADEKARDLAKIKKEILDAYEKATSRKRGKRPNRAGMTQEEFCEQFNQQKILSLSEDIYRRVKKISVPTLNRWKLNNAFRGLGGLVRKRVEPEEKESLSRALNEDQQDYIVSLIRENPIIRPVRAFEYVKNKYRTLENIRSMHPVAVYRFMDRWKEAHEQEYQYMLDPSAWKSRYQLALGDKAEAIVRFCQRWEADSTPADIFCKDGRHTGIGTIDIFSRLPVVLITETSKSLGIAAVMRRGMIELGIPEEFVKDHGQDYDSDHIKAVCLAFGIKTPWIPIRTPEAKPFIERFWRTLATGLFEELPGFCGHNVAERQAIRNREAARDEFIKAFMTPGGTVQVNLTRDELQAVIDKWIKFDYAQRPHAGLGGARPAERPAQSPVPVRRISDERVLDILLAPAIERTVQKKGIELERGRFIALEMDMHVGKRVQCRLDLTDAGRIYVFDLKNRYLFTAVDKTLSGYTPVELAKARTGHARKIKAAVNAIKKVDESIATNPMMERLDELERTGEKVTPIIRTEEYDHPSIAQARRAVADRMKIWRELSPEEQAEGVARALAGPAEPEETDQERARFAAQVRERVQQSRELENQDLCPRNRTNKTDVARMSSAGQGEGDPAGRVFDGKRPFFRDHIDRYRWCLERVSEGWILVDEDRIFMADYESKLDPAARRYWEIARRMNIEGRSQ